MWVVLAEDGFGLAPLVLAYCDDAEDAADLAERYGSCGEFIRAWVEPC